MSTATVAQRISDLFAQVRNIQAPYTTHEAVIDAKTGDVIITFRDQEYRVPASDWGRSDEELRQQFTAWIISHFGDAKLK